MGRFNTDEQRGRHPFVLPAASAQQLAAILQPSAFPFYYHMISVFPATACASPASPQAGSKIHSKLRWGVSIEHLKPAAPPSISKTLPAQREYSLTLTVYYLQVLFKMMTPAEVDALVKPLTIKDLRVQTRVRGLTPAGESVCLRWGAGAVGDKAAAVHFKGTGFCSAASAVRPLPIIHLCTLAARLLIALSSAK